MSQESLKGIEESAAYRDLEEKRAKRYILITKICFVLFVICAIGFIYLWPKFHGQEIEGIKPVQVMVTDVQKTVVKTKVGYENFYKITVLYNGEEYKMHGWTSALQRVDYIGTAYLYKGEIYATEGDISSSTLVGMLYFVCMIGGFIMFTVAVSMCPKAFQYKKKLKNNRK